MSPAIRRVADAVLVLVAIGMAVFVVVVGFRWASRTRLQVQAALPDRPVAFPSETAIGSQQATVGVIEFSDCECPYCGKFAKEAHAEIRRAYVDTGRIRWAFSNFPIEQLHPHALAAAVAAKCAARQGKFWPMYEVLFQHQDQLDDVGLARWRDEVLTGDSAKQCDVVDNERGVREEVSDAQVLGVTGTPTFLLGTLDGEGRLNVKRRVSGAQTAGQMSTILEALLR